ARLYQNQHQPQLADAEFRRSLAIVESARSSLLHEELRLPFLSNAAHLYDDYLSFLIHQGQQEKALRVADYSRAQTLLEGLGVPSGRTMTTAATRNPQDVARNLGGSILFYWLGRSESYLWAVTPSHVAIFSLPPQAQILTLVSRYRRTLIGLADPLTSESAG